MKIFYLKNSALSLFVISLWLITQNLVSTTALADSSGSGFYEKGYVNDGLFEEETEKRRGRHEPVPDTWTIEEPDSSSETSATDTVHDNSVRESRKEIVRQGLEVMQTIQDAASGRLPSAERLGGGGPAR